MEQTNAFEAIRYDRKETPANVSMHHGGDFGRYMVLKNQKLGEQFAEKQKRATDTRQALSNIFAGVTIHVDGFTSPSHKVCTVRCPCGGHLRPNHSRQPDFQLRLPRSSLVVRVRIQAMIE
jgi:hypothetical protein